MNYKIAIIGAGWYGCHLAMTLKSIGCSVSVFEKEDQPLSKASGNNQFRLHLGFHYARHHRTRTQSRDGYFRFIERYADLSSPIEKNYYAVPKYESLIDYQTYRLIMFASGIEFEEVREVPEFLDGISGLLNVNEHVLLTSKARKYFTQKLSCDLRLGSNVESIDQSLRSVLVNGEEFDFVIDATWGHFKKPNVECFYEPTLLLYYSQKDRGQLHPALTLVDGQLCSVYPTENEREFTLSSVPHTPLGTFNTAKEAQVALNKFDSKALVDKRKQMESQITKFVPNFHEIFDFDRPQLSMKTKIVGATDDRSCYVHCDGRYISIMSGKIDTIFFGAQRVVDYLQSCYLEEDF